jgi:hypothetical protein
MYHYRGWKDVTKFTDGCDLAQCLLSKKLGQSRINRHALSSHEPIGEITATPQGGECAGASDPAGVARHPDNLRSENSEGECAPLEIVAKVAGRKRFIMSNNAAHHVQPIEAKNSLSFR